jgi:hypothetical protein
MCNKVENELYRPTAQGGKETKDWQDEEIVYEGMN